MFKVAIFKWILLVLFVIFLWACWKLQFLSALYFFFFHNFFGHVEDWDFEVNCVECRELIERIITLGFYYRELERFSAKSRNLNWIRSENANPLENKEKPSVYRRALANGIVEILAVYSSSILHIEQLLLSETMPILATVTQGLNKVNFYLPFLFYV